MNITEATYPVFEANQVLTNAHLNDLFEYLDEQSRLTRANLVGIGIVCGLDISFNGYDTVHLTKGCGITSEGYLILEPRDVDLIAVRPYTLPADYGYPPFVDATAQPPARYPLWELLDDEDETGAVPLTDPLLGLAQKAVVLFLELRRDGQRTCSPNNCDDRGTQVTATLRRLLVEVSDLDKIVAAAPTSSTYLGADLTERLALPDLRMPRFDVPNTGPVSTAQVLQAFQETFRADKLAAATAAALTALYDAFKPVVDDLFPFDPFSAFQNRFGFLDTTPLTTGQVRFLQYYVDLFDDVLAAYDELRWTGVDLLCACCPPSGLFPRHLMVGVLDPTSYDAADYRHPFVRSPAVGDCADRSRQVRQLFRRLVTMLASFVEGPADRGIRATPSRWGDAPISVKAIPFYYHQDRTTPALYELWDPVRTARQRANLNLGYRSGDYVPGGPPFVTDPLRFDLEPNNFLRIEGHLGLDVQVVLKQLLGLRKSHRLPIEIVALRTGAFEEDEDVELRDEDCRFQDLETLYDTLKAELDCFLVKQITYFYALPMPLVAGAPANLELEPLVPTLAVLRARDPQFRVQPDTIGYAIEAALTWRPGRAYPWVLAVAGGPDVPGQVNALVGVMSGLAGLMTDDLRELDLAVMSERYHQLVEIAARFEAIRRQGVYDAPGLSDRLDDIVFRCRLDPFTALVEEWRRRLRDARQAQFLGHFLAAHPGVQHKAGVPLGGTFVLVYHQPPRRMLIDAGDAGRAQPARSVAAATDRSAAESARGRGTKLAQALDRLQYKSQLADDPDLGFVFQELTGRVLFARDEITADGREVYAATVAELDEGTVVADFFLPYLCGPGCATVQFQLPPTKLRVTARNGCTDADGLAPVTLRVEGGTPPLSVRVDGGAFTELNGPLVLGTGDHVLVVRDSDGSGSTPLQVRVPAVLRLLAEKLQVDQAAGTWQVTFDLEGGSPAYNADLGTVVHSRYTSPVLPVADELSVVITDAAGCTVTGRFTSGIEPCGLPCDGAAVRQGFRFWIPEARERLPINDFAATVTRFLITDADGNRFELTAEVGKVVVRDPNQIGPAKPIRTADFEATVKGWLDGINAVVAGAVGSSDWLTMTYEAALDSATTGSLFVDRLRCIQFAFQLEVSFVQGQRKRRLQLGYSSRGTVIVELPADADNRDPRATARVPIFGASTSDKCTPGEPPVPVCMGTDLKIEIQRKGALPDAVDLIAVASGVDPTSVFYFWEVADGMPSVANGATVSFGFEPVEPVQKLVRLTAYTAEGCFVTEELLIDITKDQG